MMIAMLIVLSLILVCEIAIFIVISAKELGDDERKDKCRDDRKIGESMRNPYDTAEKTMTADAIKAERQKREIEDYMKDIEALNKFGMDFDNKK